ncbi:unnamed protein product [Sphagnum balticum]
MEKLTKSYLELKEVNESLQIYYNKKLMEATDLKAHKESNEIELDQLRSSLHAAVAESITAKSSAEALKARPSSLK